MPAPSLDGITFDLGSTIVDPGDTAAAHHERATGWCALLAEGGYQIDHDSLVGALTEAVGALVTSWKAGQQFKAPETVDFCLEQLGLEVPGLLRTQLLEVTEETGIDAMALTPNIADTLATLKESGLRLGIISDTYVTPGARWFRYLQSVELAHLFDYCTWSDVIGVYKPSPATFERAMSGLGLTDPRRMAHIGDLRRTDVAGARKAGWWSVRYAGVYNDDSDLLDADFVIKDHADLPRILELT